VVSKALKERLSEEYMFKLADELLKESKLTDEMASKLGNELKERVAKRHGL
jgi:polyhydroxyalkanoate synthesis regulator phasin